MAFNRNTFISSYLYFGAATFKQVCRVFNGPRKWLSSEATSLKLCQNYAAQVTDDGLFHGPVVSGLDGISLSTDPSPTRVTTKLTGLQKDEGFLKFTPEYQQNK